MRQGFWPSRHPSRVRRTEHEDDYATGLGDEDEGGEEGMKSEEQTSVTSESRKSGSCGEDDEVVITKLVEQTRVKAI